MEIVKKTFKIRILNHDFQIRSDSEEQYVNQVVDYVNQKVTEARNTSKPVPTVDVAILTALNIADEFFRERRELKAKIQHLEMRTESLIRMIDAKL